MERYQLNLIENNCFNYMRLKNIEGFSERSNLSLTKEENDKVGLSLRNNSVINVYDEDEEIKLYNNDYPKIYGELTREGFYEMTKGIEMKGRNLMILNSGIGNMVVYGVVDRGCNYGVGIEPRIEYHMNAIKMRNSLPEKVKNRIDYFNNKLIRVNLCDVDVIYLRNYFMNDEENKIISEKLTQVRDGVYLFCEKKLYHPMIQILDKRNVRTTWNSNIDIYLYIIDKKFI